jgi:hypothetical protein
VRLAAALVLAVCGCSSQVDTYCDRTCAKKAACMPGLDKGACTDECKNASSTVIPLVRSEYLTPYLDCYTSADCAATDTCAPKARSTIQASAACTAFCAKYVDAAKACAIPTFVDANACADKWKVYVDDAFKKATPCLTRACGELPTCVGDQLSPP